MIYTETPLTPRVPGPLKVLTLGRISTPHQDMQSIEAQHAEVRRFLEGIWSGELELRQLGEQASGEDVSRRTFMDAMESIESGDFDLVILFDLSKASRNPQFMWAFMHICVDNDTRFISIGDNIDTADPSWETSAGAAALVHGTHIPHTRHRVKAKAIDAFRHGGMVTKVVYGYRKLSKEEAVSGQHGPAGLRIGKVPAATLIVLQMRDMVLAGRTYEQVAAWLDDNDIATGPYSKRRWTGKKVAAYLRNPLLHGLREFGRRNIVRARTTGKKTRKYNDHPETALCPDLAHLSPEEHAELLAEMDRRVREHPRKPRAALRPKGRQRSKTLFPGQLMTCTTCGSLYYWRGNDTLQCCKRGAPAKGGCWNHVQVNGDTVRRKIRDVLLMVNKTHPQVKPAFLEAVQEERKRLRGRESREAEALRGKLERLRSAKTKLAEAIGIAGDVEELAKKLAGTEVEYKKTAKDLAEMENAAKAGIPAEAPCDEAHLPEILDYVMSNSYDCSVLLRTIMPVFKVVPLRALDSGMPVARAFVTFSFEALKDRRPAEVYEQRPGDFTVRLDFFEPPAHVRCLEAAVKHHTEHPDWSAEKIAAAIGPEVKRWSVRDALKLHDAMQQQGSSEPYVAITDPEVVSRWRMKNGHKARWDQAS